MEVASDGVAEKRCNAVELETFRLRPYSIAESLNVSACALLVSFYAVVVLCPLCGESGGVDDSEGVCLDGEGLEAGFDFSRQPKPSNGF